MKPRQITYRAEIIGPLLSSVVAGECCSVVGMSGVGKSSLLQHMLRPDVLRYHLPAQNHQLRFVIFDTNMLADWGMWGIFEGLTDALLVTLASEMPDDVAAHVRAAHDQMLAAPGNVALAFRLCAETLGRLCSDWQIVVLFDEFDPLFSQLSGSVLRNLRGLRDRHKYRLMYLTFTRQPLTDLRDDADWDEIEPFVELLTLRELGLQPLCAEDARAEVQRYAARHSRTIGAAAEAEIVALAGGHPALLRALAQMALDDEECIALRREQLHRSPTLQLECAKIWQQLTGDERDAMLVARRELSSDSQRVQSLLLKGLLRSQGKDASAVFSPLFAAYLKAISEPLPQEASRPIYIDLQSSRVLYYGRDISGELGEKEYALLVYLWEHYGAICPVVEVARVVYAGERPVYDAQYGEEFDRMRALAGRLRRKLVAQAPDQPELLAIFHGRGYRLGIRMEGQ